MSDDPTPIFARDGDLLIPSDYARGPWHEDGQHGGAMIGLLARAIEAHPKPFEGQVVRLTSDLLRAAPLAPTATRVQIRHQGRSALTLEAELIVEGKVYARANALFFRTEDRETDASMSDSFETPPLDVSQPIQLPPTERLAFQDALDLVPVDGFSRSAMWVRLRRPLVQGEAPSPLVRLSVTIDWIYATMNLRRWSADPEWLRSRPFVAINVDASAHVHRPVEGEWVCLDAMTDYGAVGAGTASAQLYDTRGHLGTASQALLVRGLDKRPKVWDEQA